MAQGGSTRQLTKELGGSYPPLLDLRHKLQGWIAEVLASRPPVTGAICEVDDMYQNAGKKRRPPRRSGRSAPVNTDEWRAYDHLAEQVHPHPTVNHAQGEYARDDDRDGVREVHVNTMEGYWIAIPKISAPIFPVHSPASLNVPPIN